MQLDQRIKYRTLALAGILQATELVNKLAMQGHYDPDAFITSIESLYILEADNVDTIYGNDLKKIQLGLNSLENLLTEKKITLNNLSVRYFFGLLHLERKLYRCSPLQKELRTQIMKIVEQNNFFQNTIHPTAITNLADTYIATLSKLDFRITVQGIKQHLSAAENIIKVRALLLAGIRSAVLWRQLGGTRWQIIFQQLTYLTAVRQLLQQI